MRHLDKEPTRSILLTNLPRVAGSCQVSQLNAEICAALTEATLGKVINLRYSRPKGKIFVCGTRVKLFRTPDPVLVQNTEKRQHGREMYFTKAEQQNARQETTESSLCDDPPETDSYMYLPFHKHPYRPPHISEDICSRMVVPKSKRSHRKSLFSSKMTSKCHSWKDSSAKAAHRKKTSAMQRGHTKAAATTKTVRTLPKRFTVYTLGLSTLIPVQVKSNDTIAVLKAAIQQKEGIKIPVKATLWCKGYKVTEKELQKLAKNLGAEWESLAIYLDMKKADVDKFKADNPYQTEQQIFSMLVRWKETQGTRATKEQLKEKLREAGVEEEKFERVLTKVEIEQKDVAWLAEELDVLYLEQDHSVSFQGNRNDLGREFYHGGTISWFELQLGTYAVDRDIQFALEASIKTVLNRRKSAIKTLYHAPGAGGTTLARRVLWDIHLEKICPCAFVTSLAHDNDAIHKRIKWLHNKTSLPVFVVEDSRISKTESRLIRETFETCRQFTPLVILDVQRYSSKIDKDKEGDRFWLKGEVSIPEAIRLTEVFSRNCPEKKDDFEKLVDDAKAHKNPRVFEFGLTAFEYEFRGVQSYVSGYLKLDGHFNLLKDLSDWRLAVGFLSLTYYYGQAAIPGQFFANILGIRKKDTVDFGSLPFEAKKFINKEDGNYWRISIHALAKEILEQILCPVPHSRESNVRLSSSATKCLKEFTAMFIIEAGSGKERLCQDLINVVIATFFSRDNNEILMIGRTKRHLSSLILDIPSQRPLYTERYAIFQLLVEYFPRNPHCLAHLARFCALVREEYPVAKKYIEKAIQIREEERQQYHHYMAASFEEGIEEDSQGADTPLSRIYNMKGCIYQAEMSSNIGRLGSVATCEEHIDVNEVITEAVALAKTASTAFAKCREYYKKGHEDSFGYVPDIKLRLKLIEFIKKNFGDYETYVGSESADEYIKDLLWEVDSLIRECYEKVFTLPQEFHTSVDWYCLLCKDAALAIQNWTDVSSIRGRRGKLAAYRMLNQSRSAVKNIWYWDNMRKSDIEDIITLYEQNFQEVFEKGLDYNLDNDMKDWLLAIRHELIERPYTIEEVLLRVRQWYDRLIKLGELSECAFVILHE
uniref:Death domain-containing protein n=1 Tax=Branchiostoma floridae TaxID=7739 RepID=C3ZE22_BRAFL|eukprot:XP_002592967.1 hypothetical protein BRAFLDRAFT_65551 [Branchiostoma floridae]